MPNTNPVITTLALTTPTTSYFTFDAMIKGENSDKLQKDIGATTKAFDLTSSTDALYVNTLITSVDQTIEVAYTVSHYDKNAGDAAPVETSTGKIVITSIYPTAKLTLQAPFSSEDFRLGDCDNLGSTFEKIVAEDGITYERVACPILVPATSASRDWVEKDLIGIAAKGGGRYKLEVTFKHRTHDLQSNVENNSTPFDYLDFSQFAKDVAFAQHDCKSFNLKSVKFPKPYSNTVGKKWELRLGNSLVTSTTALDSDDLDKVVIKATNINTYDIPFVATYEYTTTAGGAVTEDTAEGIIRVAIGKLEGSLAYTVEEGESVAFKADDFKSLYTRLTGGTLSNVTISGLPATKDGTLYDNGSLSSSNEVSKGRSYSADRVNGLIFWAAKDGESAVTISMTMDGTGGTVNLDVKIAITEKVKETTFTDVPESNTFYNEITYCYENNIMGGNGKNFNPKNNISRIQLVVTLYRMAGSPTTYNNKVIPFADSRGLNTEFGNALKWAYNEGITSGSNGKFNPNTAVTRQALVTILYRFAESEGYDVTFESTSIGNYTDGGKVASSMRTAMNWALENGLLSGSGNRLLPGNGTTRGAAAKILANFHKNYVD